MDLQGRITSRQGEFLLFALTPPRSSTTPESAQEIADITVRRLEPLGLDGLILYDIDDEGDRNPCERPFPFLPTMDPAYYLEGHLGAWRTPVVVYRTTSKYTEEELRDWVGSQDASRRLAVFVGAPSRERRVATTLRRAHGTACPWPRRRPESTRPVRRRRPESPAPLSSSQFSPHSGENCELIAGAGQATGRRRGPEPLPKVGPLDTETPGTPHFLPWRQRVLGLLSPRPCRRAGRRR